MKKIANLFLIIMLAVFILGLSGCVPKQWEYALIFAKDEEFIQEIQYMGVKGWELAFARRSINEENECGYEMIFKRPRRD